MKYLDGDQPLLKSLTLVGTYSCEEIITNATQLKLAEKKRTTLRLAWQRPPTWSDSLYQRLQTLEVGLTAHPEIFREYWTIIQKSTTLRALRIMPRRGSAPALFHPSFQRLSIIYPDFPYTGNLVYTLEEVKMPPSPRNHHDTLDPEALTQLKLVETPVLSLVLKYRPRNRSYWDIDTAVDTAVDTS